MKNICPRCGRTAQGLVRTKLGKHSILYSFIHLLDNEDGFTECYFRVTRKKKKITP